MHQPHPRLLERQTEKPVKVADQHSRSSAAQRFNAKVAVGTTKVVGTMWCAYIFAAFDCLALPEAVRGGMYGIVQWTASFFLQLVLLAVVMVGQNIQAAASDARSEATYKDTEAILEMLTAIQKHQVENTPVTGAQTDTEN